ncbi:uncharacterized protein P884DRAFT_262981 [Thermothelomyces heterothallicus CBS 202.75]|uniref:uncharacterized protein n=1 Tax=Thermothelomyces heterothallicus CBS 202.75 TaxID=1149848 RepID=UPI003744086B
MSTPGIVKNCLEEIGRIMSLDEKGRNAARAREIPGEVRRRDWSFTQLRGAPRRQGGLASLNAMEILL